jgi:hypothetical protein
MSKRCEGCRHWQSTWPRYGANAWQVEIWIGDCAAGVFRDSHDSWFDACPSFALRTLEDCE